MADESVSITPGAGADIAVDTVAGKHYQRVKLDLGADGVATPLALGQTTKANSIPVTNASDDDIAASLDAIETAVQLIDNAVSGAAFNVILNAGDDSAGRVKLTDGTDVADIFDLANSNPLAVQVVDGAGTAITSFGGAGGTSNTDDDAFTQAASIGTPVMGVYESAPTSVTDNEMGIAGITQTRALKISVADSTIDVAHDVADSGNPVKVGSKAASALPTPVTANDRANLISDLWGRPLVSHLDPGMQMYKSYNATAQKTSDAVWTPAGGKKIAITRIVIGTYGTTAARMILYFSEGAYVAGTSQLVTAASFAPSSTVKPGIVDNLTVPIFCTTADMDLRMTTDAALSIDIALYGYEW